MASRPPPLPSPITTIVVPDAFSPSSFVQLERCALSALGLRRKNVQGLLVPHPAAFLGVVLHHVRHEVLKGRWGGARTPLRAALQILATAVRDVEAMLQRDNATVGLVPLRSSVGRRYWMSNKRTLERWAKRLTIAGKSEPPNTIALAQGLLPTGNGPSTRVASGSEQLIANPRLRLVGRPDWFASVDARHIEVVDFKSGRVTDADGDLLEDHIIQVRLYAFMLEAAFPHAKVTPFLEGNEPIEVPWGHRERTNLMDRLQAVARALPSGATIKAEALAKPGVHCRECRLRPSCLSYLSAAPRWWPDQPRSPRPLPLDVWGDVLWTRTDDASVTVQLVDASGRHVRVDGIDRSHGATGLCEGDAVWFFNLEASEDLNQHGALIQPRNFHERPPGPRWRPARRMRLFSRLQLETSL